MKDLIIFLEKNVKSSVYTGGNIHVLYLYLEMFVSTTTLTTLDQRSHIFGPSYSINNDTEYLQPVIAYFHMRQNSIYELCGSIGHKIGTYIIRSPKLLPPSLIIKLNQFKSLHGEEQNEPPI